jgi:hypothetical protein
VKVATPSEQAFLELQRRMWAEISDESKGEIGDSELFELTLQQLDAGTACGNSESFLVSLTAMARYFVACGDLSSANHYLATCERFLPEEPTLLVEGWLQFGRGELQCSAGEFEESLEFLEAAADGWFEGGHYDLWVLAVKNLALAKCMLGNLLKARELLNTCEERAKSVSAISTIETIFEIQVFVDAELGDLREMEAAAKKLREMSLSKYSKAQTTTIPTTALILAEGRAEETQQWVDELEKAMSSVPAAAVDWTWSFPLYWYEERAKARRE